MNRLLLILMLLVSSSLLHAQTGYLFVKKGIKKKRTYTQGDLIILKRTDGKNYTGYITIMKNDTIWLNGRPVPRTDVKAVIIRGKKKSFHISTSDLLLITAGVALTTAGLTLSEKEDFKNAAIAGATIGYGPLALKYIGSKISFRRKKFKIGKKFRLHILDFYLPRRGF